jgi:hypothetical protein
VIIAYERSAALKAEVESDIGDERDGYGEDEKLVAYARILTMAKAGLTEARV